MQRVPGGRMLTGAERKEALVTMRTPLAIVLALTLAMGACAGTATSDDTATTTAPAEQAAAANAPVTTEPAPTTTTTTQATTTTSSTTTTTKPPRPDSPFGLRALADNPLIERPSDSGGALLPEVKLIDGVYHMWFTQTTDWATVPEAIYHATSDDGIAWTVDDEPALTGDGDGFDAFAVAEGRVVEDGDGGWIMFYNAMPEPMYGAPGIAIGRATADNPFGPWTRDVEPLITVGDTGAWDSGFVLPASALWFDDEILLFYSGGKGVRTPGWSTGLVKIDGDDIARLPDPVMRPLRSWNGTAAWEPAVFPYEGGLAAFISGVPSSMDGESIGYAWSPDGIEWTEAQDNPLLGPTEPWAELFVLAGSVVEHPDGSMTLYYSGTTTGPLDFAIGAADVVPSG